MEKIISLKIKLEVVKYILLGVTKYKNIPTHSKKIFFLGSHGCLSLILAIAPGHGVRFNLINDCEAILNKQE